ncbi:MAG: hypothetical protein Q9190_007654 [Brigantiaea leucoxantha]
MSQSGGRPPIGLDHYREQLIGLYQTGMTVDNLIDYIHDHHNIRLTKRTIKRRFKQWNVRKYVASDSSEEIKERMKELFFDAGLNDREMLQVLKADGFTIGLYALIRLRFVMNLRRRMVTDEEKAASQESARAALTKALESGEVEGYGYNYLQIYLRQRGYAFARRTLIDVYRSLNPAAIDRRKRDLQRHRGQFVVPGPDWLWSVDGYDKLKPFGIEIYACIDAYSRYIVWLYIGTSNSTQLSCLRQYLDTIKELNRQPRFIRSDRGAETVQLADAHFNLQHSQEPDLDFQDCYIYGTSTANQRIEAWWGQMSKGLIFRWRNYFTFLRSDDHFSKDRLADQIALLAIYLPIIRMELESFIRLWNVHTIRKQFKRSKAVAGKPMMLYLYPPPGTTNYGLSFDEGCFQSLHDPVKDWDMDQYLPETTSKWCQEYLKSMGFDHSTFQLESVEARHNPLFNEYCGLREAIDAHIQTDQEPHLALLPHPTVENIARFEELHSLIQEVDVNVDHQ